ncbi:MAG TPA: haloacid dehalogenase [Anaerolineae bacterium]|nr:haloacid dehalogenase [Anaerolineae bacterium]HOR00891.1 haloacid dehalogenase [Anaerolineae bacterium]HPL29400.1 haloacid dehalogenase [Anaerolineae bacterium]
MALHNLESIVDRIRISLDAKNAARDAALARSRELIRFCANAIRAAHRNEFAEAAELLTSAKTLAATMVEDLAGYPDLYHAGYTQDALKEYAEANITIALVQGQALPEPEPLGVEYPAYLNGMGEAAGELRRYALDALRSGNIATAETMLAAMDDIYDTLVTIDFPDALTGGLRRTTDMVRGVLERTRGDLTVAARQQRLEEALKDFESRFSV